MRPKQIGQSPEYNMLYEILRKTKRITELAPHIGWTTNTTTIFDPFDPNYRAILNFATAAGYRLPSVDQQILQNQLVVTLKSLGIWDLLDALYILATDGDSDFATINWINVARFQITKVGAITFNNNLGFTPNGINTYLNTNYIVTSGNIKYRTNDAGYGGYIGTELASNVIIDWGVQYSSRLNQFTSRRTDNLARIHINTVNTWQLPNSQSLGFWHNYRTDADTIASFRNGISLGTNAQPSSGTLPAIPFYIGAVNADGVASNFSSRRYGMWFVGTNLIGKEVDFYSAWNTYYTSL